MRDPQPVRVVPALMTGLHPRSPVSVKKRADLEVGPHIFLGDIVLAVYLGDDLPMELLRKWIDESYRSVAPKSVLKSLDSGEKSLTAPKKKGARESVVSWAELAKRD